MRRTLFVVMLCLSAAGINAKAEVQSYQLDPEHLSVGFLVDHIGYAKVLGMFREASGSFDFDEDTGVVSNIRVEIVTDSVFTNHKKRDKHLRGSDFLNVSEFPEMVFTASSAKAVGGKKYRIEGEFTLLGVTRPLTLEANWNKSAEYPIGGFSKPYVTGISARGVIKRSEYGMRYALDNGWVGDEIELLLEMEAKAL